MEKKENNNGEKIKLNKSLKDVVLGLVVPFFLFWLGISVPFFTDSWLVLFLSLLPFYAWCFVTFSIFDLEDESFLSILMSFFTSLFFFVITILFQLHKIKSPIGTSFFILAANFLPSFSVAINCFFYLQFSRYRGPYIGFYGGD